MSDLLRHKGPIAWMANNPVAANLLMAICLLGGLAFFTTIKQEVFPDLSENVVSIRVAYPGAAPEEVEQGICRVTEEAIRSLDGVKEVTSTAGQGSGSIQAELMLDAEPMKVYQDIQKKVDRITTYPKDAEEPQVSLSVRRNEAIKLVIYGDIPESSLCELAETVRDRLLQSASITQIDLSGVRDREIHIEVSQANLRRYNITHREIAAAVASEAVELPGGGIKTRSGETLLRMKERRDYGTEFARVPVAASEDGTPVRLEDIGTVTDGFEDSDRFALYNGKPSVMLEIYRVGDQTPADISNTVYTMIPMLREQLPVGVQIDVLSDSTERFFQRADLLLRNGAMGLLLVIILLGIFLELRVAFWVMMGIPVSILGSMILMPAMDLTINMITMFAYLITLGIVVDDAIVVGENVYHYQQEGKLSPIDAAIKGTREVCSPVAFSILTNIVAFIPLMFLPGTMGKIMGMLPLVVITVFTVSWLESLYILPAHLSHVRQRTPHGVNAWIHNRQQILSLAFTRWVHEKYSPFLDRCLHHRYLVVAASLAL
ncbi:MAG: efflux RND transporter permease subunit, partial [Kiritimatiellaceae bacterium]|nr:efflux RND transporter permease subunit [Kiritimatiellaceae bacterium]